MANNSKYSTSDKIWARLSNVLFPIWGISSLFGGHFWIALICAVLFLISCYWIHQISEQKKAEDVKKGSPIANRNLKPSDRIRGIYMTVQDMSGKRR